MLITPPVRIEMRRQKAAARLTTHSRICTRTHKRDFEMLFSRLIEVQHLHLCAPERFTFGAFFQQNSLKVVCRVHLHFYLFSRPRTRGWKLREKFLSSRSKSDICGRVVKAAGVV
jgi:hypothetical protein